MNGNILKKTFFGILLLSAASAQAACPAGWICPKVPILPPQTKVGAWYSIYFYKPGATQFDHWKDWTRYKPMLGYYDSGDVIKAQYPIMKAAGIDYLLLDDTNGLGNDNGEIHANALKVFDDLPADLPVAIANGAALYNAYDGNMNFISREQRRIYQKNEADIIMDQFARRSNYLKWYDPETKTNKPLLVVYNDIQSDHPNDEIIRYWKDPRYTVRYAGGYMESSNPFLIPYENMGGLWGWAVEYPQSKNSETMMVQAGWNTSHIDRPHPHDPLKREGGKAYMRQWLAALKQKPSNIIIPSWNDWAEETAIEPAVRVNPNAELWTDYYGVETPDWYLQITTAYTNLRKGLMAGGFYKTENDPRVYQVVDGKLVHQTAMPHKRPVIVLPDGALELAPIAAPPSSPSIPSGLFMVGVGIYQATGSNYCHFQSMTVFTQVTGKKDANGIPRYSSIPSNMKNVGACKAENTNNNNEESIQIKIPEGLFVVGHAIYYSNGHHYCYFPSMTTFTRLTGRTDVVGVKSYSSIPGTMVNDGNCK